MPVLKCFALNPPTACAGLRRRSRHGDRHFGPVSLEDATAIGIRAYPAQVAEEEEGRHLPGRDHAHQVEIQAGPAGDRHMMVVAQLGKGAVGVILPDAAVCRCCPLLQLQLQEQV